MPESARHGVPEPPGSLLSWSPVLVGIGAVVGLLVAAFALPLSLSPAPAGRDGPAVAAPSGVRAAAGRTEPAASAPLPPSASSPPSAVPPPRSSPSPSPSPSPPEATLAGTFRVVESFEDAFTGEVRIVNPARAPRDWVVRLRFPGSVGRLVEVWVESAPQATVEAVAGGYRFQGTAPVGPRSVVVLRFMFSRTGDPLLPEVCTVNGRSCAVRS